MKNLNIFLLFVLFGLTTVVLAQEKQKAISGKSDVTSTNENVVKSKITAANTFKLPLSVEVFSGSERDERNRVIVRGWDIKGKIISAAVSSVGNLAGGAGGGAAAASYARVKVTISQPETGDEATTTTDENGNFSLKLAHDAVHTIYVNGVEYGQVNLKTKHDTAKNSVGNIR